MNWGRTRNELWEDQQMNWGENNKWLLKKEYQTKDQWMNNRRARSVQEISKGIAGSEQKKS